MKTILKEYKSPYPIYVEYISNIIKLLPNAEQLMLLRGTSAAQVPFYFKTPNTNKINSLLYNNFINQRYKGIGQVENVEQVITTNNSFTNDYYSVYLKLSFVLSIEDKTKQKNLVDKTFEHIKSLCPIWNDWIKTNHIKNIPNLDKQNPLKALIQMTIVLETKWVNPKYIAILKKNRNYPYTHTKIFKSIFSKIPTSVPLKMINKIKQIYEIQGEEGALISLQSNALQTLSAIRQNVSIPTKENGGLILEGSSKIIPGLLFNPQLPNKLLKELAKKPPKQIKYSMNVTQDQSNMLFFKFNNNSTFCIAPSNLLQLHNPQKKIINIFNEKKSGSYYHISVVVNNPTFFPIASINPLPYDLLSGKGWFDTVPVLEALKNSTLTDVTGYVFDNPPSFNFKKNGDFGYIKTLIISQFLQIEILFEECDSEEVQHFFDTNIGSITSFLGIPLKLANHTYEKISTTKIIVKIKPPPPGFYIAKDNLTNSLCQLLAVSIEYPFALT